MVWFDGLMRPVSGCGYVPRTRVLYFERCLAVVTSRARACYISSSVWLWLCPAHVHIIFYILYFERCLAEALSRAHVYYVFVWDFH